MKAKATLPRRRRAAPFALGLGLVAVAAIVAVTLLGGDEGGAPRATTAGGNTATVERRTLVQRETVDGTLGYSGNRTVINRLAASGGGGSDPTDGSAADKAAAATAYAAAFTPALYTPAGDPADEQDQPRQPDSGPDGDQEEHTPSDQDADKPADNDDADDSAARSPSSSSDDWSEADSYSGSGTVTSLPKAGSIVRRGDALYHLDGDPIVLMYGSTPAFRALKSGVSGGGDVGELEQNLAALGFDPGTVDDSFTSATAAAVGDWQESVGLERTGTVELGRVAFLPGQRRVGERKTSVGSVLGAGTEVLVTSSTKRVVAVELDASLQDLARRGERVDVTLPDGSAARGHITAVGRVAREVDSGSGDPNAEQTLVIDVMIELRSRRGIGRLDEAPVGVGLAQEWRRNVLAVPVNALVARPGGGYGVELAGSHRIAPVEAGLFADGYVEVSGGGIRAGTRVVVPRE